jgi:hypothetical protein
MIGEESELLSSKPLGGKHTMNMKDIYFKLRAPLPTPADEICQCRGQKPVKLMTALGENPVHCIDCNLEVSPEVLGFDTNLVEMIADWRSVYDAVDRLWLDSGEYESWAECELSDIQSPINVRGLKVRDALNEIRRCYFWFFQDQSQDDFTSITLCPSCQEPLIPYDHGIFPQLICEKCSIITVG